MSASQERKARGVNSSLVYTPKNPWFSNSDCSLSQEHSNAGIMQPPFFPLVLLWNTTVQMAVFSVNQQFKSKLSQFYGVM